jgi:hypothetical protein
MQISSFNSLNEIFFLQCEKYQKEDHLFFNNLNLKNFRHTLGLILVKMF